ncbi:MAG: LCP family protein [Mogibacterium sp.]|nr:LCP family protein [Mogibacterium sp.]
MANENTESRKPAKSGFMPAKGYGIIILIMALVAAAFMVMLTLVSAFPKEITMAFVGLLFVLLILVFFLFKRRKKGFRILGLLLAVVFLVVYGVGTYYLGSTYAAFNKIGGSGDARVGNESGADITNEAFNIYITGIDQWNDEKGLDLERSDVNMIVTVCPQTRKILMTSIPRDTYVRLHTAGQMDKLTHTGVYGVDETLNTVEDWLGVNLDYYVKCNFSSVMKIIYAIGGIEVYSPKAFKSSISDYEYEEGWNYMGGKEALYFARERKAFNNEDDKRVENQQAVLKAVLNKMMTSPSLLTSYPELLEIAAEDLETNMSSDDMQALVRMQLADLGAWDIEMQKITGEYDMDYVASLTQEQKFQVYRPDDAAVAECLDNIDRVMNPTPEELQAIEEEQKKSNFINFLRKIKGGSSEETEENE